MNARYATVVAREIHIQPADPLQPEAGFSIRITSGGTRGQDTLLFTAKHPVSGNPIMTLTDALTVAMMYAEPPAMQPDMSPEGY